MNRFLIGVLFLVSYSCFSQSDSKQDHNDLGNLFSKEEVTIVITDSGLGGLLVMDDISEKLNTYHCFKHVNLIFVNALFDAGTGYNSLKTRNEKISRFNDVLWAIDKNFHPDAILIACNTLSVIYGETGYVRKSDTPVIGIVEAGIKLIKDKLTGDVSSSVIIFGTETTIEENKHKKGLLESAIAENRIITKACPQLQSYIEQNPSGEETAMLISIYLNEALEQLPDKQGKLFLSLNCSHFGYSIDLWKKALSEIPNLRGEILDPNHIMGNILIPETCRDRFSRTDISFRIISKVELENMRPLSAIFRANSPELAAALENYTTVPDLF